MSGEVSELKLSGELIWAAIEVFGNSPYGARVDINRAGTHALQLQCSEVALVKLVETLLFREYHDRLLAI